MAARFLQSAADSGGFPSDHGAEVAFAGRSNSGKSSAINAITGVRKLARVSKTPGRTRLVNFFEISPGRRIVDLPGYGYAQVAPAVRQGWRRLVESYLTGRRALRGVMVTADIRRGLTELDETMIEWARSLDVPVQLLLTKTDKLSRSQALRQQQGIGAALPEGAGLTLFSAQTGLGVAEARECLERWLGASAAAGSLPGQKKGPGGGPRGRR